MCWAEMSLPSLGGKRKNKKKKETSAFSGGSFASCQFIAVFQSSLLESQECVPKRNQPDLKSNNFRQAFYSIITTNTREHCNANRIEAPNSQLCAVNSVLLNSAFNLILQKNSLINSEVHTLSFIHLWSQTTDLPTPFHQFTETLAFSNLPGTVFHFLPVLSTSVCNCSVCAYT